MKKSLTFAVVGLCLIWTSFVGVAKAQAATYYVDCAATSSGNGSSSTPWQSLGSASSFTYAPGDSVLLKKGCVFTSI